MSYVCDHVLIVAWAVKSLKSESKMAKDFNFPSVRFSFIMF